MFQLTLSCGDKVRNFVIRSDSCLLGRAADNDVVLQGWRVPKRNARIWREGQALFIEDTGDHGNIMINGRPLRVRDRLHGGDQIRIASFNLQLHDADQSGSMAPGIPLAIAPLAEPVSRPHEAGDAPSMPTPRVGEPRLDTLTPPSLLSPAANNVTGFRPQPARNGAAQDKAQPARSPDHLLWQQRLHQQLLRTIDIRRADLAHLSDDELLAATRAMLTELVKGETGLPASVAADLLIEDVLNEAVGLGPLERLLADESISEIMVNGASQVFVERHGKLQASPLRFSSNAAVQHIIERIVSPLGRRIDESLPLVDARLKDGSRVNAIIPPLALQGPCLTIRRFMNRQLLAGDLVRFGTLSPAMVGFLEICVACRRNIVIAGGTGSGKTTLLNVLSNLIPEHERIITIEDAAELQLNHTHLVSLEARPANVEGSGCISIRDLVRNALRMRPDRIVVGECRGGEALDMLQAMNTGHDGSLTTAHANGPRDLLSRLETMVLMAGIDLPAQAIREQIAAAVDIIVHQTRFTCGSRKVTHISEVTGVDAGKIQLQDIFVFDQRGFAADGRVSGHFRASGFIPTFYEELSRIGVELDLNIFNEEKRRD